MTRAAPRFEDVYAAHFDFVWRTLARLGVPASHLEDAAQDVFVVVHRRLATFEGRSKITTWLFAICYRVASGRRNRACHRREIADGERFEERPGRTPDPLARCETRELLRRLEGILGSMTPEQRGVFVMFELEGLAGDAIAEALELPLPTVHSRLRLARAAFRRAVERQGASERRLELRRGLAR